MENRSTVDETYKQVRGGLGEGGVASAPTAAAAAAPARPRLCSRAQTLETLEADGGCCGFGVPGRCEADRRVPASVPATCGEEEGWYPTSSYCAHTVRGVVRGCRFDQPVGDCSAALVAPSSVGCAAEAESWVFGKAAPVAYLAVIFWVVHGLAICTGVCLCLKRKDTDVLPHVDLSARKRERLYYAVRLGGAA